MQIARNIYKVSGVEYETNSNIYAISYDGGIALIDCGYQKDQWDRMNNAMRLFNLSINDVTHVFLTHAHFDHAGNVHRCNDLGIKVLASRGDAEKIAYGNPEMEKLFGAKWICGKVDHILKNKEVFEFPGNIRITAYETPGHCKSAMSYMIEDNGIKALATGDMFFLRPCPPEDKDEVELGYMGSEDFDIHDFRNSLMIMQELQPDLLLPGHYYTYFGERMNELFDEACHLTDEVISGTDCKK